MCSSDLGGAAVVIEHNGNIILRSTMVMNGRGEFVVTAVGDATEIGKVAKKSTEQDRKSVV